MEYAYTSGHQSIRIQLDDHTLTMHRGDVVTTIPYRHLYQVRLSRAMGTYQVQLLANGHKPVVINSRGTEDSEGSGRTFGLFIRVLHHHLHYRSKTRFCCGPDGRQLAIILVIFAILASALLWLGPWTNSGWPDQLLWTGSAMALAGLLAWILPGFLTRKYSPLNIPLQYLP